MVGTLLLIEDEALLRNELARHFRREEWEVITCENLAAARKALLDEDDAPLVVVSDMQLPDGNSLDLLEEVRQHERPASEWLFLTGYGSIADSKRAMRLGAFEFLEKPCEQERLDLAVAGAARSARAQRRLAEEIQQQHKSYPIDAFVGESAKAGDVRTILKKLSQVPFSALVISGETGTGKGLATRIIHYNGKRAGGPLIEINCAALPRELLESELFGHEAGAFTDAKKRRRGLIEQAHGGTLFLDEIAEMELDLQAKLLKVIEDQRVRPLGAENEVTVDVQVVAATNRDIAERIRNGSFRSDLYHRLSVFGLELPSLRTRVDDLDQLIPDVIAEFNLKAGKCVRQIAEEGWAALKGYDWPGNVRELRNVIERCVLFSEGEMFPLQWLQLPGKGGLVPTAPAENGGERLIIPLDGSMSLEDMDRYIIATAVERAEFNLTAAARSLGTTRQTLRYRVKKYGLKVPAGESDAD